MTYASSHSHAARTCVSQNACFVSLLFLPSFSFSRTVEAEWFANWSITRLEELLSISVFIGTFYQTLLVSLVICASLTPYWRCFYSLMKAKRWPCAVGWLGYKPSIDRYSLMLLELGCVYSILHSAWHIVILTELGCVYSIWYCAWTRRMSLWTMPGACRWTKNLDSCFNLDMFFIERTVKEMVDIV